MTLLKHRATLALTLTAAALALGAAPAAAQRLCPAETGNVDLGVPELRDAELRNQVAAMAPTIKGIFERQCVNSVVAMRNSFNRGWSIGNASSSVRYSVHHVLGRRPGVRFFQTFSGGTWGNSSLSTTHAIEPAAWNLVRWPPQLVTGSILARWSQLGHASRLGGPRGIQYRARERGQTFVRQDFEIGQVGFNERFPQTLYWRRYGGAWQR